MRIQNYIVFKISAKLLIAASVLCVLFGNGTHMHFVFDRFSDHDGIHVYVHAHPGDSNNNYDEEFDGIDAHQHQTVTIELAGTLTQKIVNRAFTDEKIFTEAGEIPSVHSIKEVNPLFWDLPPPDLLILSDHFYSLSLRGPPIG